MRRSQRTDAAGDDFDEPFDVARFAFRLVDQSADEIEDVAHAVVEFGNQQFLLLLRAGALGDRFVGEAQDDLEQRDTQPLGNLDLRAGPLLSAPLDRFLPCLEALAGSEARPVGAGLDRLFGIARPGHRLLQRFAPQHQIVTRSPRNGDDERTDRTIGEPHGTRQAIGDGIAGEDATGRSGVEARHDRAELFLVRRGAAGVVDILDEDAGPVMRDRLLDDRLDHRQAGR